VPNIFDRSVQDLRSDAILALEEGGKITNFSTTSVARQLLDTFFDQLSEFYETIEFHNRMTQLSTSSGLFLDLIGESRGISRSTANRAVVTSADRNIRFYSKDGTTPLYTLLTSGQIPENTLIQNSDLSVSYLVSRTITVNQVQTQVYVPAVAVESGEAQNVGAGTLILHDLAIADVAVVNDQSISSGFDDESDDNYRFRISRALDEAAGATEEAIRSAVLTFPDVVDVRFRNFSDGVGSYEVLLVPRGNEIGADIISAVDAVLNTISAFGVLTSVRVPDPVPVELVIQLTFRNEAGSAERIRIKEQARLAIIGYLNELSLADPFIMNELIQRVMDTNNLILDMKIMIYRFNNEPRILGNVFIEDDEILIPSQDVASPIQVI